VLSVVCVSLSVDVELFCCVKFVVVFELQSVPVVFTPCITEHCVTTVLVYISGLMIKYSCLFGFSLQCVSALTV